MQMHRKVKADGVESFVFFFREIFFCPYDTRCDVYAKKEAFTQEVLRNFLE